VGLVGWQGWSGSVCLLLCACHCRKQGNVARFINHSCEPNCETQKWMVRGELAIGLFTLRKIKAGKQ
jgi:SET domain-containing protein